MPARSLSVVRGFFFGVVIVASDPLLLILPADRVVLNPHFSERLTALLARVLVAEAFCFPEVSLCLSQRAGGNIAATARVIDIGILGV
jgi:hypothetical protein